MCTPFLSFWSHWIFSPFVRTCLLTFVVLSEAKHYWRILYVVQSFVCACFFFRGTQSISIGIFIAIYATGLAVVDAATTAAATRVLFFLLTSSYVDSLLLLFCLESQDGHFYFHLLASATYIPIFSCVLHVAGNERRRAQTETLALRTITFFLFFFHTFLFLKFCLYIYLVVCKSKIGFTLFYITWDSFVLFSKKIGFSPTT